MALQDTTHNVYGPNRVGDISFVFVTLIAGTNQAAIDTGRSSPGITCSGGGAGTGVYTISFSANSKVSVLQSEAVNTAAADKINITSAAFSSGTYTCTVTKSDSQDCAGSEEIHLVFASMANP